MFLVVSFGKTRANTNCELALLNNGNLNLIFNNGRLNISQYTRLLDINPVAIIDAFSGTYGFVQRPQSPTINRSFSERVRKMV